MIANRLYIQSLIYNYELEDETVTPAQLSIVRKLIPIRTFR